MKRAVRFLGGVALKSCFRLVAIFHSPLVDPTPLIIGREPARRALIRGAAR